MEPASFVNEATLTHSLALFDPARAEGECHLFDEANHFISIMTFMNTVRIIYVPICQKR